MSKRSILITSFLAGLCGLSLSCHQELDGQSKSVNSMRRVQVGSREVTTTAHTLKGTPVVPMWKAAMPTTDIRQGAGFTVLNGAQHAMVWQPSDRSDGAYNHYAALIYYKGRFFAMWGNNTEGEDAPGQRVLFAWSDQWGRWSAPRELFPAPGPVKARHDKGIHLKPDRWAIIDDTLYSIVYVHGAGRYPIARSVSAAGVLGKPFVIPELPAGASLPVFMQDLNSFRGDFPSAARIKGWYSAHHQISWWAWSGEGIPSKGIDGAKLIESFTYQAADGELVLCMRNWGTPSNPVHNNRMYVSFNDGKGSWEAPYPSDIPDAPSRAQAISLDDGTVLLIGNQNASQFDQAAYLDRDPLTVSVSRDGYTFEKVYALRTGSPAGFRFSGIGGRNPGFAYPSALVHKGWLYVLYSIGKEDMAITRVPLSALGLPQ
jgi:hypothetical protein